MKKIFGYIFLVVGFFLAFALTLYVLSNIRLFIQMPSHETSYNIGYSLGMLLFFGITTSIIVVLIRTGFRWIKKSIPKVETYEDVIDGEPFENR